MNLLACQFSPRLHRGSNVPVCTNAVSPEHYHSGPDFPLSESSLDVLELDPVAVGDTSVAGTCLQSETVDDELLFMLAEKFGRLRAVGEDEVKKERHCDRQKTLKHEDPLPACFAGDSIHELNGVGEEAGEGARHRCSGVENSHTLHHFVAFVPDGQEVD